MPRPRRFCSGGPSKLGPYDDCDGNDVDAGGQGLRKLGIYGFTEIDNRNGGVH